MFGLVAFALGWAESIALVWAASVYANIMSDWASSEAADDSVVLERLDRLERMLKEVRDGVAAAKAD